MIDRLFLTPRMDAERHLQRADVAAALGRHAAVQREVRAALTFDPTSSRAWEMLAWSLMEQRAHDDALTAVGHGLAVRDDHAYLHYLAGVIHHRRQRLATAEQSLLIALQHAPTVALYHVRLARVRSDRALHASAVASVDEALRLAIDDAFVLGECARVLLHAGEIDRARALAQRRLAQAPDDPWSLVGLASIERAAGAYLRAEQLCRRALHAAPNLAPGWSTLATTLDAMGRVAEAESAARELLRIAPSVRTASSVVRRVRARERQADA